MKVSLRSMPLHINIVLFENWVLIYYEVQQEKYNDRTYIHVNQLEAKGIYETTIYDVARVIFRAFSFRFASKYFALFLNFKVILVFLFYLFLFLQVFYWENTPNLTYIMAHSVIFHSSLRKYKFKSLAFFWRTIFSFLIQDAKGA